MRVFLASGNAKKIGEMQRILAEHVPDIEVLGIADVDGYVEPVEDQPTFEGNALLKARAGVGATGLPSIADDSGLCVDALNGMPGVLSARWSGPPKSEPATTSSCSPSSTTSPTAAWRPLHLRDRVGAPRRARARRRGPDGRPDVREERGRAGSATTSSSSPTSTPPRGSPPPSSSPARRTASPTAAARCASWRRTSPRTCQSADAALAVGTWRETHMPQSAANRNMISE